MVFEFVTAFTLGILSTSNPCAIPLYPGFLVYLTRNSAKQRLKSFLAFAVVLGILTSMLFIGVILNLLALSLGRLLTILIPLFATILATVGLMMILNINSWHRLRPLSLPAFRNSFLAAFVYGMLYGPISLPCIAPLLLSIFASSLLLGETVSRMAFFILFGLGLSLPLFIIGLLSDTLGGAYIRIVTENHRKLMITGGLILMATAIYSYITFYSYGIYFV